MCSADLRRAGNVPRVRSGWAGIRPASCRRRSAPRAEPTPLGAHARSAQAGAPWAASRARQTSFRKRPAATAEVFPGGRASCATIAVIASPRQAGLVWLLRAYYAVRGDWRRRPKCSCWSRMCSIRRRSSRSARSRARSNSSTAGNPIRTISPRKISRPIRRSPKSQRAGQIAGAAIARNEEIRNFAFPKRIATPLLSRYEPGMNYGPHADAPFLPLPSGPHALRRFGHAIHRRAREL